MDIKKRDFLRGFGMVSAGGCRRHRRDRPDHAHPDGGYPPGVPRATGKSMLDSPHYIGEASKGYGFKANWARTLPHGSQRRSQLQAAPHQQGDRAVGRQSGRLPMRIRMPPARPTAMRKASAWPRPIATPSITRWRMTASASTACAISCRAWSMAAPRRRATAPRWCLSPCRPGALTVPRCAPMSGRSIRRWRRAPMAA